MSNRRQLHNHSEVQEFILDQLGENISGITFSGLLLRFKRVYAPVREVDRQYRLLNEISHMRELGVVESLPWKYPPGSMVYRLTVNGWLAWARGKQEKGVEVLQDVDKATSP